jgi:hypothetical protein
MQNHLPMAWILNEQIDPGSSLVDGHEQSVNRVWLEMRLAKQSYPNQDQRNLLNEIASQCVTEGGPAVLRARHILNKYQLATLIDSSDWQFFIDTCGTGNRLAETQLQAGNNQEESWILKSYPNPSGNSFQLQFGIDNANWTYELWSSTGQKVLHESLEIGTTHKRITIPDLAEGLYIGLWKRNGKTVKSHRQMIMK